MKYPKRSQYKYAKSRYRVRNWAEYEAGLQNYSVSGSAVDIHPRRAARVGSLHAIRSCARSWRRVARPVGTVKSFPVWRAPPIPTLRDPFDALCVPYKRETATHVVDARSRNSLSHNECPARDSNPKPTD